MTCQVGRFSRPNITVPTGLHQTLDKLVVLGSTPRLGKPTIEHSTKRSIPKVMYSMPEPIPILQESLSLAELTCFSGPISIAIGEFEQADFVANQSSDDGPGPPIKSIQSFQRALMMARPVGTLPDTFYSSRWIGNIGQSVVSHWLTGWL